jgi:hypothetical protein
VRRDRNMALAVQAAVGAPDTLATRSLGKLATAPHGRSGSLRSTGAPGDSVTVSPFGASEQTWQRHR